MRNKPHAFLILCVLWKIEVIIILLLCCIVEMAERIWCYFSSGGILYFHISTYLGRLGSTLLFLILNRMRCWTKNVPQMAIPSSELISIHIYPSFLPFLTYCFVLNEMKDTCFDCERKIYHTMISKRRILKRIANEITRWKLNLLGSYLLGIAHTLPPYVVH